MKRRQFIKNSLLFLGYLNFNFPLQEENKLTLEEIQKIKEIQDLTQKNFTLVYELYKDDHSIGKASIRYSAEERIIDAGIDKFYFFATIYLVLRGIVDEKFRKLFRLKGKRDFMKINNESWERYKESFGLQGEVIENSTFYVYNSTSNCGVAYKPMEGWPVDLFKQEEYDIKGEKLFEFHSKSRTIYNILYGLFAVLNNSVADKFNLVGGKNYVEDVSLTTNYEGDYKILKTEVILPQIGRSIIEAKLLNNIPIHGNLTFDERVLHGKIENIIVNGREII